MAIHARPSPKFDGWVIEAIRQIVTPRAWELYAGFGYPVPSFITL
jgi:hypothetical protein